MFDNTSFSEENDISRRDMLKTSGKIALGATLVPAFFSGCGKNAYAQYPWPYKKLDAMEVGKRTYENWYQYFCSYAVVSGIFQSLAKVVGEPYASFPMIAMKWGHGGAVGWGTLCGTLTATGFVTGLAAGETGEKILNDVIAWYAKTNLPIFKPDRPRAAIKNQSISNSPLCHVSVAKWSSKEGKDFFSKERRDRCARLSADVAMQTVTLLNAYADGKYKPTHGSQIEKHKMTAQDNCDKCHK